MNSSGKAKKLYSCFSYLCRRLPGNHNSLGITWLFPLAKQKIGNTNFIFEFILPVSWETCYIVQREKQWSRQPRQRSIIVTVGPVMLGSKLLSRRQTKQAFVEGQNTLIKSYLLKKASSTVKHKIWN